MGDDGRRVELVDDRDTGNRTAHIGLGLLASLVVGLSPLTDALRGNGSFEGAIGRYLVVVAVCVGSAAVLGRLLDNAPRRGAGGVNNAETTDTRSTDSSAQADGD